MGVRTRIFAVTVSIAMLAATQRGWGAEQDLVSVELLSSTGVVQGGQPFTVGAMLHVKPGWHVYWMNPGDSGLATKVKFLVPEGWTVGPVQYPLPVTFHQPGEIVGYGYKDEVMLMAQVTPPATLAEGKKQTIGAEVSWLCCEKVCIPGKAKPELSLAVSNRQTPANAALFDTWLHRLAIPVETSKDVQRVRFHGGLEQGTVKIELEFWKEKPSDTKFYPTVSDGLEIKDVKVERNGDRVTITFSVRALAGQDKVPDKLPVLVVLKYGEQRGVTFDVPLRQAS